MKGRTFILYFLFLYFPGNIIFSQQSYFENNSDYTHKSSLMSLLYNTEDAHKIIPDLLFARKKFSDPYVDSIIFGQDEQRNKWTMEYSGGKIVTFKFWYLQGEEWRNHGRKIINYDSSGNIVSKISERPFYGEWISEYKDSCIYDSNNNLVCNLSGFYENGQWLCYLRSTHVYNEFNDLIFTLGEKLINDVWEKTDRIYVYYRDRSPDSTLQQDWNNGWHNSRTAKFEYENPDLKQYTSVLVREWRGTEWVDYYRESYKYDASGNQEYNFFEEWDGLQWNNIARYFYTFNNSNLTAGGYCEIWHDGTWCPGDGHMEINWLKNHFRILNFTANLSVYYTLTSVRKDVTQEKKHGLFQNYPNPFNPNTTIEYFLTSDDDVKLVIYDILGNEIEILVDEYQISGKHKITFNAGKLSSGVYIYMLMTGTSIQTKKMILKK